jgi:N-acetylmuramoyl-L-alanine amidase
MTFSLIWLPSVLTAAGLKVIEQPGWQTRGRGNVGAIKGVICHHTAGGLHGNMPSLGVVTHGRPDLAGPLAQLCLGRDGTFFVVAAGRANHAGNGKWQGFVNGNSNFIGIEAENTGLANDPWPEVQMDAYRRGVAAILKHIGAKSIMCAGHKEYALPHGRKGDPSFDMDKFRAAVAAAMGAGPSAAAHPAAA